MQNMLFNDDCLAALSNLPSRCIDAVLCDPPYGTTRNQWDSVIPLADLWCELKRVLKRGGGSRDDS